MKIPVLVRRLVGAAPDLALAAAYAAVLADPQLGAGPEGEALWRAAVLEFFAVHASGFLKWTWVTDWSMPRRLLFVAGLAGAYSAALGIASLIAGGWWPLVLFWALTANRMVDAAVREAPKGRAMEEEARAWAGGIVLYALAACVAGVAGVSPAAVFAAGAGYFAANGLSELTGWIWVDRWMAWARRRSAGM